MHKALHFSLETSNFPLFSLLVLSLCVFDTKLSFSRSLQIAVNENCVNKESWIFNRLYGKWKQIWLASRWKVFCVEDICHRNQKKISSRWLLPWRVGGDASVWAALSKVLIMEKYDKLPDIILMLCCESRLWRRLEKENTIALPVMPSFFDNSGIRC